MQAKNVIASGSIFSPIEKLASDGVAKVDEAGFLKRIPRYEV